MITLAFDPGVHHIGFARFDGTKLTQAQFWRAPKSGGGITEAIWLNMHELEDQIIDGALGAVEVPQIYNPRKWKGDPQDLINIAVVSGQIVQGLREVLHVSAEHVRTPLPHDWKGSVDADVMMRRIEGRLAPGELSLARGVKPASLRHNVVDAIGIGLWAVGRL